MTVGARDRGSLGQRNHAWHETVAKHASKVYAIAYRLTGDSDDASDLACKVFLHVSDDPLLESSKAATGWFETLTARLYLAGAQQSTACEQLSEPCAAANVEGATDAHNDAVQIALDELEPGTRAALILHDVAGLPRELISDALAIPLETLGQRLFHGRNHLMTAHAVR